VPALLALVVAYSIPGMAEKIGKKILRPQTLVALPPEKPLWDEIKKRPYYQGATHFYCNENWVHQVFAGIPQKMVWPNIVAEEASTIPSMWERGNKPFFVANRGSDLHLLFQRHFEGKVPGLAQEEIGHFVVYYRE
jgi:hypothetical protein